MNPYNIANPPVGIYRGDLPISYAYINVLNDIHARHLQKQGFKVNCPLYSFNSLGKRAESLGLDGTIEGLRDYYQRWRSRCNLRHRLGLIFEGEIADCSEQSIFHAQNVLVELSERGFVEKRGDETYLDITRIKSRFPCEKLAESIEFYPQRARTEFLRMVRESGSPIRVSKDRVYSARNPLGGSSISPIFVVSNMWDAYFKDGVDCISCSEKELARYILLRFYSRVPLSEVLPMKKVFVPNLIQPEGGYDSWDVSDCTRDEVSSDALRYAISKSLSQNKQSMIMKKALFKEELNLYIWLGTLISSSIKTSIILI